jgi:ABC-type transport system substrate-binding protein
MINAIAATLCPTGDSRMPFAPHRHGFPRFAALALFLAGAAVVGLAGQPPKEVEDPKGGVKKKIAVDDGPVTGKKEPSAPVGNPPDVRLDELVRAAGEAREANLKALLTRYAVPFDRLVTTGGVLLVRPLPLRKGEWPADPMLEFAVTPVDEAGRPRDGRRVRIGEVRAVEFFETLAQAEAEKLLKEKGQPAAAENAGGAEKLLAAALRFHDYAREKQVRRGKTWDEVRDPLAARLREVRLDLLRAAVAANDPVRIRDATARLLAAYPKDPVVAQEVGVARVGEADRLLKSPSHLDHMRARELLDDFESRFPGGGGEPVKKLRLQLRDMAARAFTRAKEKKAVGDLTTARDELARAAALDPTVDGLRDMQRELRTGYPILHVGVRQYPVNISPSTARLDSEKQAVELVFEGLIEEVPQDDGAVHYRPGAAQDLPTAVPGGRDFLLRAYDRDPSGRPGFDSHDVVGTIKLLGNRADTWEAYPLPWLGGLPTPKDANAVRVPLGLGHPDPRAAFTFKLLPARWMVETGKQPDDPGFAERPFGTGPFKFHANPKPQGTEPREMIFIDNPAYGRWRDRNGLPQLREIRLVDVSKADPAELFRADKLHVLTDIPTADIEKYTGPGTGLASRVQVVTSAVNRRVHVLAVNLERPHMQSKALRRGISMAIDREDILREVFRAGKPEYHRAMTGPYPPNSWAAPKGAAGAVPLMNRDLAALKLKEYLTDAGAKTDVELAYPEDDPRAEEACRKIKAHVEGLTKDGPAGRRLVVNLVALPMRELLTRVYDEHRRYDLAYVPFDYPDDWHPYALGAALDPNASGRGGRNWFNFLVKSTNPDSDDARLGVLLNELRGYRDFAGQLAPKAAEVSRVFNECLPFIPLWQLDRHTVVHNSLKVYVDDSGVQVSPRVLNPTTLFQGVARWRLD